MICKCYCLEFNEEIHYKVNLNGKDFYLCRKCHPQLYINFKTVQSTLVIP